MSKIEGKENNIEFLLKIQNEAVLNEEINLLRIHPFFIVGVAMKLIPKEKGMFQGIDEKNGKIYIKDEELKPFYLIHKFPQIGTYKIKIEVNEKT